MGGVIEVIARTLRDHYKLCSRSLTVGLDHHRSGKAPALSLQGDRRRSIRGKSKDEQCKKVTGKSEASEYFPSNDVVQSKTAGIISCSPRGCFYAIVIENGGLSQHGRFWSRTFTFGHKLNQNQTRYFR